MKREIIIIGGGLAGLISAILLKKQQYDVLLIEKKKYPFHRVCGEYISNEVVPFLQKNGLYPDQYSLPKFDTFRLTAINGKSSDLKLDLGGFGISRYVLDEFLYQKAMSAGIEVIHKSVTELSFDDDQFNVMLDNGSQLTSNLLIGAFGKRSNLDKRLNRSFINKRSPYLGVKHHIRYDGHEPNIIALHNFQHGYCGINQVEDGKFNLCYLSRSENLRKSGSIAQMEENILCENPELEKIFNGAEFLFDKPKVINEISFETKNPIENHVLMCGDAAGMITPLCGNGMAMAIRSAKVVVDCIIENNSKDGLNRAAIESSYLKNWNKEFRNRLWAGRQIQNLFGSKLSSNLAVSTARNLKPVANFLVTLTHGKPF